MTSREVAKRGGRQVAARSGRRLATQRVIATEAARDAIARLRAAHGALVLVQSAGRPGASAPVCAPAGEYLAGAGDMLLGTVAGCPFYMDLRQYQAWHPGQLVLDVEPGTPRDLSLAPGEGQRFVTRAASAAPDVP